jgi:hypothetical protein
MVPTIINGAGVRMFSLSRFLSLVLIFVRSFIEVDQNENVLPF